MMTDDELRTWAESARWHEMTRAAAEAVLRLLGRIDDRELLARRCHDLTDQINEIAAATGYKFPPVLTL